MRSLGKRSRRRKSGRQRIGQVSYYQHHGGWHVYYRDGSRQVRRRAGDTEEAAAQVAAQVNAQLAVAAPTLFSFTPLSVQELRRKFLDHHEHVIRSSLATVSRYKAATQHLENFARTAAPNSPAHLLDGDQFVRYLRTIRIAPNGHNHAAKRTLRDKGIRFILETCRSLYGFAAKKRHLPPYGENPFAGLGGKKFRVEDAKPVFVFDAASELHLLQLADDWSFPIHFILAKTGLRVGELVHLLVEDLDLEGGWLHVRNKPELGWRIKTGRERAVPLIDEAVLVLRAMFGGRRAGPVFLRELFQAEQCPIAVESSAKLATTLLRRVAAIEPDHVSPVTRARRAQLARTVWRDAGATRADRIRSSFSRAFKTELFWIVSRVNNCQYCLGHQESGLLRSGLKEEQIAALDSDWSRFTPAEQAAFAYARKFTHEPHKLSDGDIDALRKHYTEMQILEMSLSMAFNNAINRWKEGVGVPQNAGGGGRPPEGAPAEGAPRPVQTYLTPTPDEFTSVISKIAPYQLDEKTGKPTTLSVYNRPKLESREDVEKALAIAKTRKPRLPLVDEAKAREVYGEAWTDKSMPQWARLLANFPGEGRSRAMTTKTAEEKGDLKPLLKAQVSWIIARQDRAWYATGLAKQKLASLGVSEDDIYKLDGSWDSYSPADRAMFTVARKLAASPVILTDADVDEAVKQAGPRDVVQLVNFITTRAAFDRITEAAGLQLE